MSSTTTLTSPVIPQASLPGDIVGMVLQNAGTNATVPTEVTFGQVFLTGAVQPGAQLYATLADGAEVAVQMDAKTFNADGSVADAVLTFEAPTIAAGASEGVMLSVGPALSVPAPPIDLAAALANYSLTVDLTIHNADGSTTPIHIDAVAAMEAALANGTASYWLQGANATQARVTVPVAGTSMQMQFDITANANGTFSTDVQFLNEEAWVQSYNGQTTKILNGTAAQAATGGTVIYDETITQNGAVVSQQKNITQYQYQNWDDVVTTQPSVNQINVQHDVAYLEATGAVQNYDLSTGVQSSVVASEAAQIAAVPSATQPTSGLGSAFGAPLSANGVDPGMGGTGGRPDIGPTTGYDASWLITQNATTAEYALGQADAAGAVPWNLENGTTGTPLTTSVNPDLWSDGRGSTKPVQGISQAGGWDVDMAHQPALSYDTALLSGSRYLMDETENQGAFAIISATPSTGARDVDGYDDIVVYNNQIRGAAWDLRDVINAAQLAPAGSAEKAYYTQVETDNFSFLISQEAHLTAQEGQAYGYIEGGWGNTGGVAPWQQDYLYSTIAQAALQGNAQAKQIMGWMDNFIVGRFLAAAQGFMPQDGIAYELVTYSPSTETSSGNPFTATYLQTWAAIEQATTAAGQSTGADPDATNWLHSQGDYGDLALVSLADTISVFNTPGSTQSAQAIQAYGWLLSAGDPYISLGDLTSLNDVQFDIAPRLADGTLLGRNELLISTDKAGTTNTLTLGPTTDQLITAGAGNDLLQGGNGIDLLFAGSGNDTLIAGANNDYLYGGTGTATLSAGAGINYLTAGTGADTFIFKASDIATDTIAGFKIGTDQLDITGADGNPVTAADIQTLIANATTDANNDTILHLSPTHSVTLLGITPAMLAADGPFDDHFVPAVLTIVNQTNAAGVTSLISSGQVITGGTASLTVVDTEGANTINGGSGGLNLTATGAGDIISTAESASDTLQVSDQDTVSASGTDVVTITGTANAVSLDGGGASIIVAAGSATNAVLVSGAGQSISLAGDSNSVSVTGASSAITISGSQNTVVSSAAALLDIGGSDNDVSVLAADGALASGAGSVSSVSQIIVLGGSGNLLQNVESNIVAVNGGNGVEAGGSALVVSEADSVAGLVSLAGASALFADNAAVSAQGDNLIVLTGGSNTVSIGGAATLFNLAGATTVTAAQGAVIYGGDGSLVYDGGSGLGFIHPGLGSVTAIGGSGGLIAYGGADGDNLLEGGTGSATLFGGGGGDSLVAGSVAGSSSILLAGAGNETLNASGASGFVTLAGAGQASSSGSSLMIGGAGTNLFYAGSGAETMMGGNGESNIFVFGAGSGGGTDFISGYRPDTDKIELTGGLQLSAPLASGNGVTKISLSDGTQITLSGILSGSQAVAPGMTILS